MSVGCGPWFDSSSRTDLFRSSLAKIAFDNYEEDEVKIKFLGMVTTLLIFAAMLTGCVGNTTTRSTLDSQLFQAVHRGDVSAVRALLSSGANPNVMNTAGATILHSAVYRANEEVVGLLITAGADINNGGKDGYSPLHMAASQGHGQIVRILAKNSANLEAITSEGLTPLNEASRTGQFEAAKELVRAGANINAVTGTLKSTSLMWAALNGKRDVVRLLLENNADTELKDSGGGTALNICMSRKHYDVCSDIRAAKGIKLQKLAKIPFRVTIEQDGKQLPTQNNQVKLARRPFTLVYEYEKRTNQVVYIVAHASRTDCFGTDINDPYKIQQTFGFHGTTIFGSDKPDENLYIRNCAPPEHNLFFHINKDKSRFHSVKESGNRVIARRIVSDLSPGGKIGTNSDPLYLTVLETLNHERMYQVVMSTKMIQLVFTN